jgi:hypothetical protein
MAIDFSALVLAPGMNAFARPIMLDPRKSQPLAQPYPARGIWTVSDVELVTEDGGKFSNRTLKLGIRLAEFPVLPKQGDWVTTAMADLPIAYWQEPIDPNGSIDFTVDDARPDGQGGMTLILKRVTR